MYMHEVISTNTRVECIATSPRMGMLKGCVLLFFFSYFFYFLVNRKHKKSPQKILRLLRFVERDSEQFQEVIIRRHNEA